MYEGATLTLTPWAAQALSDEERHAIAIRLVDLHARAVVGKSFRDQAWSIRISSWNGSQPTYVEQRPYSGLHLATCIHRALDDYAAQLYTPEEILQIAQQSGLVA